MLALHPTLLQYVEWIEMVNSAIEENQIENSDHNYNSPNKAPNNEFIFMFPVVILSCMSFIYTITAI